MARYAIVIGIDKYANEEWNLGGAVDDAVRFAEWAIGPGGVDPANLRLLLSSAEADPTPLPHVEATRSNITQAIQAFQSGKDGTDGERLYFYYAGHGLSAAGATAGTGPQEPVLIPSDIQNIQLDADLLLGFSKIIPALSAVPPAEQFFFLDACRDFAFQGFQAGFGHAAGMYTGGGDAGATSKQSVLYATAPGERAQESKVRKQGVFGGVLLDALRGAPPPPGAAPAAVWNDDGECWEVRFSTLVEYVTETVEASIKKALPRDWARFLQVPQPMIMRTNGQEVLATVTREQIGTVGLPVRVKPSAARDVCRVALVYRAPGGQQEVEVAFTGPGLDTTATLEVTPGHYWLVAVADSYAEYRRRHAVYSPVPVEVPMEPAGDVTPAPTAPPGLGGLEARCADAGAVIMVWDPNRVVRGVGTQRVRLDDIEPGLYSVRLQPLDGERLDEQLEVVAGGVTEIDLVAAGPHLGDDQLAMLEKVGMAPDDAGYLQPSEQLDPIANARLASLLAFAAFAAHSPDIDGYKRLKEFGVQPVTAVPPGGAGLLVLIGVGGDLPAPGVTRERFLTEGEVLVRNLEGETILHEPLARLSGMPAAGQAATAMTPGCVSIEFRLPGLAPTRYSAAALPDRVTTFVAVAEDDGEVEVHQYLLPLGDGRRPVDDFLSDGKQLHRLELAQRAYCPRGLAGLGHLAGRRGKLEQDTGVSDLLYGKWLDPLLGALAGYALVRQGRAEEYVGHVSPGAGPQPSALHNMLEFFGGLPDSHVLAGLCEPDRRDEHFGRALELGLPLFAEGFRALYAWYRETQPETARPIWVEPSALLPGSLWTAWIVERPALLVKGASYGPAPAGWGVLEERREAVERALAGVGRIGVRDAEPLVGTAFAVAPRLVATMAFVIGDRPPDGFFVDFGDGPGESPLRFDVEGIVAGVERPDYGSLVLLRTAERARDGSPFPAGLALASAAPVPVEGRRVFVAGYPAAGHGPDDVLARVFGGVYGVKRLQPGQLLEVDAHAGVLRHDCYTLPGNAGSPVVDLETGCVLAVHHSGLWLEFKRGDATPLWPLVADPALAGSGARFG